MENIPELVCKVLDIYIFQKASTEEFMQLKGWYPMEMGGVVI